MRLPNGVDIPLWRHQQAMLLAPAARPLVRLFFLVAGYGSGKSFTGVMAMLSIAFKYWGQPITVGVGGVTIKMLRSTLLSDLFRLCLLWGIPYEDRRQDGIVRIGTTTFIIIGIDNPDRIFAYNFSIFLGDEIDELTQEKALAVFKATQERTRVTLPDGRVPYSMFFTTAQGYKGTYTIINRIRQQGLGHYLIRGNTKDNKALDPSFYRQLWAMYSPTERLVYLEGHFANLTAGRVYYEYDDAKHLLREEPFEILPSDEIHVGQDLNAGFSRGTAYVKRVIDGKGVLFVARSWSFAEIANAPMIMRRDFPTNEIFWYPDASGNEVLAGYREEMREHDIELRSGAVNPSVVDRIFVMNKLLRLRRMYIFPQAEPLAMALKIRGYDDHGKPEKGEGPEAPDHYCDGAEYGAWRIVRSDPDFFDIYSTTRSYRKEHPDQKEAA